MLGLPLWDIYSHPEHLLLEVLLVVTQSTSEEEEAGAVGLTLTHKHRQVNCATLHNLTHILYTLCCWFKGSVHSNHKINEFATEAHRYQAYSRASSY